MVKYYYRDINNSEISRELEQVKYRESNISLNQESIIEILFNFFLHKTNNPKLQLFFRFVTNSKYTTERPALFIEGKGGIEVWQELSKTESVDLNDERLLAIKKHLLSKIQGRIIDEIEKIKPDDVEKQKLWTEFKVFVDDSSNLLKFIKDFEWSNDSHDYDEISNAVQLKIKEVSLNNDLKSIDAIYSRLFLFVFKLLTNRGLKRLDSNDLVEQMSIPKLSTEDGHLLSLLNQLFKEIGERVSVLEEKTILNTSEISKLVDDVNLIRNSDTVFDYRLNNIATSRPILIKNGSLREEKVNLIIKYFNKYKWIGFQGINGTGKSQLASLIANKFNNIFWLDLRSYNDSIEKTTLLIETFLYSISNHKIENNREIWLNKVFCTLSNNTIIVLNDIPNIEVNSPLFDLLKLMSDKISVNNVRLLTTSNYKLPKLLIQSVDDDLFFEYYDFEFSDKEIIEYIVNLGGDESVAKYINLITVLSYRNPRILSSIIYYVKNINWGKDSNQLFDVILNNEFSNEILQDAQSSIKKYIKDEKSRELLYRLSLFNWNLSIKEISAVSQVEEKIQHPNEKLQDIINIWIEQQDKSYLVSPLIYNIGEQNLSPSTIQETHVAIAKSILEDKKINQINGYRIVSSFLKGKDFNNAGFILLMIYQSARSIESVNELKEWGYLSYWSTVDIPAGMDVILRAQIRNEQVRLSKIIGEDYSAFVEQLISYVSEDSLKISEKVLVNFLVINSINPDDFTNYWSHFDFILKNLSYIDEPFKEVINVDLFTGLLWIPLQYLVVAEDIKQWLEFIERVENHFQINFFENEISQTAIAVLSGKITNSENSKPIKERNVQSIINRLEYLIKYFRKRNNEALVSIVMREIISIEFQIFRDASNGEKLAVELAESLESNVAKYLLYDNLGKLYYNEKNISKSKEWLFKAIEFDCCDQVYFVETLIYAACSVSESNTEKAVELIKRASELSKVIPEYDELNYIQILGELGIAYWLNGEFENSFVIFEDVVNRLLEIKEKSFNKEWIRIFSWTGHTLGYISAEVSKDKVPTYVSDGGDYIKPYLGIYMFNTKDLSDLYLPTKDAIITANMSVFADGVNDIYKAYSWSLKAFDIARNSGDEQTFLMISAICGQYSTINFKLEESLEASLLFSALTSHLSGTPAEKISELERIDLKDLLHEKPSEKWNIAEENTVLITIIPLFIIVLTNYLENRNNKEESFYAFQKLISNYIKDASDKHLWNDLLSVVTSIIEKKISKNELIQKANQYGDEDKKNFQIICLLGHIFYSRNEENAIIQLINAFPYLTKTYKQTNSLIKFILVPFVKLIAIDLLKASFVGSRTDLEKILNQIESFNISTQNPIQKILQPVVDEFDIKISDDRKLWLYNFKEI
ncbi:hypothetical protein [Chryseobacterium sp. 18068]|uniref:hypothetical protein n=1 Tax=Chryseobacterium sp. 18068 TaxID=2681414 RepID=UPI00135BA0CE|nr:hypothetical protein [Chryseobacterium sp. 18068]